MKKLLQKLMLTALPLLLLFIVVETYWWYNKELVSIEETLAIQEKADASTYYLRKDFSSNLNTYKVTAINKFKPEILVIGTSRVLEFRNIMFTPYQGEFYTAGGSVRNIYDVKAYIDHFKKGIIHKPKLLIIGLDFWLLKKVNQEEDTWLKKKLYKDDAISVNGHQNAFKYLVKSWALRKNPPYLVNENRGIGGLGKTGFGYRKDGSVNYKNFVEEYVKNPQYIDRETPPIIERIKNNISPFNLPFEIDLIKVEVLLKSIKEAQKENIEVAVFFPPFSNECFNELQNSKQHSKWWSYYNTTLKEEIKKLSVDIIDCTSPSSIGLDDRYMIDGYHPSEVLVTHAFLNRLKQGNLNSKILRGISTDSLQLLLNSEETLPISFMRE